VEATAPGFFRQSGEERGNGGERVGVGLKSSELRMVSVTFGAAGKNLLSKECLSPSGDQTFRVKVSRM